MRTACWGRVGGGFFGGGRRSAILSRLAARWPSRVISYVYLFKPPKLVSLAPGDGPLPVLGPNRFPAPVQRRRANCRGGLGHGAIHSPTPSGCGILVLREIYINSREQPVDDSLLLPQITPCSPSHCAERTHMNTSWGPAVRCVGSLGGSSDSLADSSISRDSDPSRSPRVPV